MMSITNTPNILSAPGFNTYRKTTAALECLTETKELQQTVVFSVTITDEPSKTSNDENIVDFMDEVNDKTLKLQEDFNTSALADKGELLRWHYRLGHLSFVKMKILMILGILPKKLIHAHPPVCVCCLAGSMTKQPKNVKGSKRKLRRTTKPGECVSIDQLESHTPGFLGVLRGFITKKRYTCATIFVDHYSGFTFYYPQCSTNTEETLKAKRSFEAYCRSLGVLIFHYHADNGRFCDKGFMGDVTTGGQTISFCGANAHWQNGITENKIRDIQKHARKMILFAKSKWPAAVNTHLWSYAIHHAVNIANMFPKEITDVSPLEKFGRTSVLPQLKTFHTFGCPVYALDSRLQTGNSIPK